jgi:hypothetical protein
VAEIVLAFLWREVVDEETNSSPGMALFTFATAVFFHHDFADQNQMVHFLKVALPFLSAAPRTLVWHGQRRHQWRPFVN